MELEINSRTRYCTGTRRNCDEKKNVLHKHIDMLVEQIINCGSENYRYACG